MFLPGQCRAARGLLGLSQDDFSERSGITRRTIHRFEAGGIVAARTVETLQRALEECGIEIIDEVEGVSGAGVKLKWGVQVPARVQTAVEGSEDGDSGTKALNERLAAYWQAQPERWVAFSPQTQESLLEAMFGASDEIVKRPD